MMKRTFLALALLAVTSPVQADSRPADSLKILVTNDDGLTSNLVALYGALKAEGHDVLVSVPCTGQSGRGGALVMYSTTVIVADNDKTQIDAEGGCHNGAAPIGAPAVGAMTRAGYNNGDFYYVHGTPVMATMYGLDVLARARWGGAPDLVLSGPNEGQNVGIIVNHSGTIGNTQFALGRGLAAIALSAGTNTVDNTTLNDPDSKIVAAQAVRLIRALRAGARAGRPMLPEGVSLNVNFPNTVTTETDFAFARIGSFQLYNLVFRNSPPYGLGATFNDVNTATEAQRYDESVVSATRISVSAMQVSFDHSPAAEYWLARTLKRLFR